MRRGEDQPSRPLVDRGARDVLHAEIRALEAQVTDAVFAYAPAWQRARRSGR